MGTGGPCPCTYCGKALRRVSQGAVRRTPVLRNAFSANRRQLFTAFSLPLLEIRRDHQHSRGSEKPCFGACVAVFRPVFPTRICSGNEFFRRSASTSRWRDAAPVRILKTTLPTCPPWACRGRRERVGSGLRMARVLPGVARQERLPGCEWAPDRGWTKRAEEEGPAGPDVGWI